MNLKAKLSTRIGIYEIREIVQIIKNDTARKEELYALLFDDVDQIGYQAAWIFTHLPKEDIRWLCDKKDALIDEVLTCKHVGKRRLFLSLLNQQPVDQPPRIDFLDFCLNGITSLTEPVGVKSLCIKLAFEICRPYPELSSELRRILENMEEEEISRGLECARRNVIKRL